MATARPDALHLAAGALARTADLAMWSARTAVDTAHRVPVIGSRLDDLAATLAARGEEALVSAAVLARDVLRALVREVVAAALLEMDLTRIVRDHVDLDVVAEGIDVDRIAARLDLDAVIDRLDLDTIVDTVDLDRQVTRVDLNAAAAVIDVDAIASRVDLDAIIARIDLLGLANQIIEDVDLPQIIRDSTGSLSEEAVRGVRSQGMQADDAVAGFVGRLFGRDRHEHERLDEDGTAR
ncbi:hypothetical protein ACFYVR_02265 [Rhodococcus sp. NPDC003318]|uniref:hypothetical protein n=1 Tax=Rhodococcus sp. NPDC003318 TaxID=3364503 RepID=UPI00367FB51D